MRSQSQDPETKTYMRRYRRHRCLAGRFYEQLPDISEDRESYMETAVNGLEGNFQRNKHDKEQIDIDEIIRSSSRSFE